MPAIRLKPASVNLVRAAKPLLITDTAHAGRKAPSVHHPRALVGCMLRSAQLARSHAPARCALVAAVPSWSLLGQTAPAGSLLLRLMAKGGSHARVLKAGPRSGAVGLE